MKLRGPIGTGEIDAFPQYVAASVASLVLLCLIASVQARNGRAVERVKLPKEDIARLPRLENRRELVFTVAIPPATDVGGSAIPVVTVEERETSLDRIVAELERIRQRLEREQPASRLDDVTILIRADAEVPAGVIQQLVKHCQDTGFQRFSLKDMEGAT